MFPNKGGLRAAKIGLQEFLASIILEKAKNCLKKGCPRKCGTIGLKTLFVEVGGPFRQLRLNDYGGDN